MRKYLNISMLENIDVYNRYDSIIKNIFKPNQCQIITYSTIDKYKYTNINRNIDISDPLYKIQLHSGILYKTFTGSVIFIHDYYNGVYLYDLLNHQSIKTDIIDFCLNICDRSIEFNTLTDCLQYLREVKLDHAISFDIKDLIENIFTDIYTRSIIRTDEIVSI